MRGTSSLALAHPQSDGDVVTPPQQQQNFVGTAFRVAVQLDAPKEQAMEGDGETERGQLPPFHPCHLYFHHFTARMAMLEARMAGEKHVSVVNRPFHCDYRQGKLRTILQPPNPPCSIQPAATPPSALNGNSNSSKRQRLGTDTGFTAVRYR